MHWLLPRRRESVHNSLNGLAFFLHSHVLSSDHLRFGDGFTDWSGAETVL